MTADIAYLLTSGPSRDDAESASKELEDKFEELTGEEVVLLDFLPGLLRNMEENAAVIEFLADRPASFPKKLIAGVKKSGPFT